MHFLDSLRNLLHKTATAPDSLAYNQKIKIIHDIIRYRSWANYNATHNNNNDDDDDNRNWNTNWYVVLFIKL